LKFALLVIVLVFAFFLMYAPTEAESDTIKTESSFVKNVVDGDTVELINGTKIRLYGINTPEKGRYLSKGAADFLSYLLNGQIELKTYGNDLYNRSLAVVYANGTNVNLLMVRNGFATAYMTEENDFKQMENEAIANELGLWKKSNVECVTITTIEPKQEYVLIKNDCKQTIQMKGWSLKDDGRKTFVFNSSLCANCTLTLFSLNGTSNNDEIYWDFGDVWNDDGDRAFLRDDEGLLVDCYNYKK
jgi:endonuclease YncB( thermonuclease family)